MVRTRRHMSQFEPDTFGAFLSGGNVGVSEEKVAARASAFGGFLHLAFGYCRGRTQPFVRTQSPLSATMGSKEQASPCRGWRRRFVGHAAALSHGRIKENGASGATQPIAFDMNRITRTKECGLEYGFKDRKSRDSAVL